MFWSNVILAIIYLLAFGAVLLLGWIIVDLYTHRAKEGKVIGKYHQEAGTTTMFAPFPGNPGIMMPYFLHHDEDWVLVVQNDKGIKGRISVDERTWKKARNGQYISAK